MARVMNSGSDPLRIPDPQIHTPLRAPEVVNSSSSTESMFRSVLEDFGARIEGNNTKQSLLIDVNAKSIVEIPDLVAGLKIQITQLMNNSVRLSEIKQTSSVIEYYEEFVSIISGMKLTEDYVLNCFIDGLEEEIKWTVKMYNPQNLHNAYCLAKLQEFTRRHKRDKIEVVDEKEVEVLENIVAHKVFDEMPRRIFDGDSIDNVKYKVFVDENNVDTVDVEEYNIRRTNGITPKDVIDVKEAEKSEANESDIWFHLNQTCRISYKAVEVFEKFESKEDMAGLELKEVEKRCKYIEYALIKNKKTMQLNSDLNVDDDFEWKPGLQSWLKLIEALKDSCIIVGCTSVQNAFNKLNGNSKSSTSLRMVEILLHHSVQVIESSVFQCGSQFIQPLGTVAIEENIFFESQHVLHCDKSGKRFVVIHYLAGQIEKISFHNFVSLVVKECFIYGKAKECPHFMNRMFEEKRLMQAMMKDHYGNYEVYVVQRVVKTRGWDQSHELQNANIEPNEVTTIHVSFSCTGITYLTIGKWIHFGIGQNFFLIKAFGNECYCVEKLTEIFEKMSWKHILSLTVFLQDLASNRLRNGVLKDLDLMLAEHKRSPVIVNACTLFRSLHYMCVHKDISMKPRIQHHGCMIKILAQYGVLEGINDLKILCLSNTTQCVYMVDFGIYFVDFFKT